MDEYIYPDAQVYYLNSDQEAWFLTVMWRQARELDGKRPSQSVVDKMA